MESVRSGGVGISGRSDECQCALSCMRIASWVVVVSYVLGSPALGLIANAGTRAVVLTVMPIAACAWLRRSVRVTLPSRAKVVDYVWILVVLVVCWQILSAGITVGWEEVGRISPAVGLLLLGFVVRSCLSNVELARLREVVGGLVPPFRYYSFLVGCCS